MNYVIPILHEFWLTIETMAPYLLLGFAIAGVLSVLISPETVERHLGGSGTGSVIRAALFGVPLPLCSCSVIPVTVSLRKHGAGRGASTAFLISTPQTGIDSIMVTYALLGPVMAVVRPLVAFISGVIGGVAANNLRSSDETSKELACKDECCSKKPNRNGYVRRSLRHGFYVLPDDMGGSMLVGILVAGIIAVWMPASLVSNILGGGLLSMLAMILFGIPLYVCATASVPIAAALIAKGGSPGVALVFLMTGPATNAVGIATVWRIMGAQTAITYLATTIATALAAGLLLDKFIQITGVATCHEHMETMPALIRTTLAIALITVLIFPIIRRHLPSKQIDAPANT